MPKSKSKKAQAQAQAQAKARAQAQDKPNCPYCTLKFEEGSAAYKKAMEMGRNFNVRKYPHVLSMCIQLRDNFEKKVPIPV